MWGYFKNSSEQITALKLILLYFLKFFSKTFKIIPENLQIVFLIGNFISKNFKTRIFFLNMNEMIYDDMSPQMFTLSKTSSFD